MGMFQRSCGRYRGVTVFIVMKLTQTDGPGFRAGVWIELFGSEGEKQEAQTLSTCGGQLVVRRCGCVCGGVIALELGGVCVLDTKPKYRLRLVSARAKKHLLPERKPSDTPTKASRY